MSQKPEDEPERSSEKPIKVRKNCKKRPNDLRKSLVIRNVIEKGMESYPEFVGYRHKFIETLRDEIQNSSHFDKDMIRKIEWSLKDITVYSGDYSKVVDTDEHDGSNSSSSSSSDSEQGSQHENADSVMERSQVNFANHVERVMKKKFPLLDDKIACMEAAKLAIAVKMSDKDIFEMKLDKMVSFYRMPLMPGKFSAKRF